MKKLILLIACSLMFLSGTNPPPVEAIIEPIQYEEPAVNEKEKPKQVIPLRHDHSEVIEIEEPVEVPQEDPFTAWLENMSDYDAESVDALAHMAAGEYHLCDTPEQKQQCAAVIECAMWRVLAGKAKGFADTPKAVCSMPHQFLGYNPNNYVSPDLWIFTASVYYKCVQVINGCTPKEYGCVLPTDYLWFHGDGKLNHFRNSYTGGTKWDWSWGNPYE